MRDIDRKDLDMTRKTAIPALLAAVIIAAAGGAAVTAQPQENQKFGPERLLQVEALINMPTPR
jgi:hypothetical protein